MLEIEIDKIGYIREAEAMVNNGDARNAINLIEWKLADSEMPPAVQFVYARALFSAGDMREARTELLKIISEDVNNPAAIKMLGDIAEQEGDPGAVEYYRNYRNELMDFQSEARAFWEMSYNNIPGEGIDNRDRPLDRKALIESINKMLGNESRKIWPFETVTLAELFIKQGHVRKGLAVYSRLLQGESGNEQVVRRVAQLLDSQMGNS